MHTLLSSAVPPNESAPLVWTSTNLCPSYFPGRGLGYSLFVHAIAFTAILIFPVFPSSTERYRPPQRATDNRSEDRVVMYIPTAPTSFSKEGLIYPGPELIGSDSPQPTSRIQTLLHPELEDLPIVNPPLDLPNLLPMPEFALVQEFELPDPAVGLPDTVKPEEQQLPDPSDGVVTEPIQQKLEDLPIVNPPFLLNLRPMPKLAAEPTVEPQLPKPAVPVRLPSRERDLPSVLALTAMPTRSERPVEIPAGEALGRFTVSPEPNLDTSETEPGWPSSVLENEAAGPAGKDAASGDSDSVVTLTFGSSPGKGALAGITVVGGVGEIETSGWAADSSPGQGALAGFTILGGVGGTGASANSAADSRIAPPLQTRYGAFVVSTENSGGGLPYFGVFSNAQINTVYLDMRQTETDQAPFWTLEFVVPAGTAIQANPAGERDERHEGFVLPVPLVKEKPALPLELVRRHIGKMVIVYTVISVEGKMEQLSVKESPDPLLNKPVLEVLSKWVFQPGALNGGPVAVKALLGIPLWLPIPPG